MIWPVFVITEPSGCGVSAGSRTPTRICLTEPAGRPLEPGGLGGGSGSMKVTFNVRVEASYDTVWLPLLTGS